MRRFLSFAAVLLLAPLLSAQAPHEEWRTIETEHFRVHFPRDYEEWATRAASRLESIRLAVSHEVGFTPSQKIDVVVANPIAQPNGSAWPLLDTPRMIFWAEPPGPDEQLGAYGHWIDLLAVHETAHVVHMLRPSRNPFDRMIEKSVMPFNPITLHAPRWVLEGYATVIEGRLTGAGRPSSTIRALILRRWAENGQLPSYGQLNTDRRFLGMSMAYLMGSAYLEWLEQRNGPDSLRNLWARMTARQRRSFNEAFAGVFGEQPDRLYGRFLAEVTASAVSIDRHSELREGVLFQETPRASGDPAVSPDGERIAVVVRDRDKPQKLVVWSTGAPEEEEKKFSERLEKILARDPQDVPPLRTKPLARKAVHELVMPDGGDIETPRWSRDGKSILFAHRAPDADGFLHFDLYRWDFDHVERVTTLADVRDGDPLPDGRTAVAVRSRFGASQLVTVDLTTGAVIPRDNESIDVVRTHPRVSPDGARIAHVAHRDGAWTLFVDDVPLHLDGDVSSPEWLSPDELVVSVAKGGFAELHRVSVSGDSSIVTRSAGGAFSPAPSRDGRLFFMSLNPQGYVVRVLPADSGVAPAAPVVASSYVPAIPPQPSQPVTFAEERVQSRAYGIGRQEPAWFVSHNIGRGQRATEIGVRLGDIVGRLDTLLIGSIAHGDLPDGVALAAAWRGWPVELDAHLYKTDDDDGAELRAAWSRTFPLSHLKIEGGALSDELVFGSADFTTRQVLGLLRFDEGLAVEVDDQHYRGIVSAAFRSGSFRIGGRYQHDGGDTVTVGGLASSILPRSAYALRVLDPALPASVLTGDEYDGWRIDATTPLLPMTMFYRRHEAGSSRLSLAGLEASLSSAPFPVLKIPGLDFTLGVARILDEPLRGKTNWWLGMRWRP